MRELARAMAARQPSTPVGWRGREGVRTDAFLARVQAWRALSLRVDGARVGLYLADGIEFGAALLGAWQAGKTVWLASDTLAPGCRQLWASVDAMFGDFPPQFAPLAPSATDRCALAFEVLPPSFDALVVHTSGSTGAAQPVPKKLAQLSAETDALEALFGARLADAAVVATVSHQHIYGLLFKILWPLAAGRGFVARSLAYPEQLASALGQRPCVLVSSPAHLKRLPPHLDWSVAGAALRAVFSSGAPLPGQAAREVESLLGLGPLEVYGSSESGGIAWRQRGGAGEGCGWHALPGVEWRVSGEGLLEVRSKHLPGPGWRRMADRATPHADGGFELSGRSDSIVKIEGKRIAPAAVETALMATGLAAQVRVIVGPEAPGLRTVVAAVVVLSGRGRALLAAEGARALNRRLRELLRGEVEPVAMPRCWRYPDRMPADAQGKVTYAQLAALVGAGLDPRPRTPQVVVLEHAPRQVTLEVLAPAGLFYFDGHFDGAPVLPGVVQLDWAIRYGRRHFALGAAFCAVHALKFQHVIRPGMPVMLELNHDPARGSLAFRYYSGAGQHATGRIDFGPFAEPAC